MRFANRSDTDQAVQSQKLESFAITGRDIVLSV